MAETRAPGVSVSAIARRYRMNADLLFTWLRDPRFAAPEHPSAPLIPVEVIDEPPATGPDPATPSDRIEIELASGARLRCAADIDPAVLARLLSAIERAP